MKKYVFLFLTILFPLTLFALDTITGSYSYTYGDSESLVEARQLCKDLALRDALESYSIYIESSTTVENYEIKEDILHTIASGYLSNIEILEQTEEGRTITTTVQATVQPEEVKTEIEKKIQQTVKRDDQQEFSSEDQGTRPFFGFLIESEKKLQNIDQLTKQSNYKEAIQKLEAISKIMNKHSPDREDLFRFLSYECLKGRVLVSVNLLKYIQFNHQRKPVRARNALVKANQHGSQLRVTVQKFESMKNLSDKQKLYRASVLSRSRRLLDQVAVQNKTVRSK